MLEVSVHAMLGKSVAAKLAPLLRRAHRLIKLGALRELSVALVNDRTMSRLHFQYLGVDGPTDVLTFPLERDRRGRVVGGEVVVCVPEARRQAKLRGTSVQDEVLLYALHGMLHLCGFDDRTDRGYRQMHRKEDQILARLGVGAVFEAGNQPSARRPRAFATMAAQKAGGRRRS